MRGWGPNRIRRMKATAVATQKVMLVPKFAEENRRLVIW
jgi:hypothetical protein